MSFDPNSCKTLVDLLRQRSQDTPDEAAYVFLKDGETDKQIRLTYGQLDKQARAIGAELTRGLGSGQRALMLYPPGLEFVSSFFGCLYAGVTAVPAYPPLPGRPLDQTFAVAMDAMPGAVLTSKMLYPMLAKNMSQVPAMASVKLIDTQSVSMEQADRWTEPDIGPDTVALLQYTSGSTSAPKGVMINHSNLLANARGLIDSLDLTDKHFVSVSWLPQYHDMGLIGPIVCCIYNKADSYLMSAFDFLQKPVRWLQAISHFKADIGAAPNFAYELCARKVKTDQCEGLDLSCWTSAINAAEPIMKSTLERFAQKFKPVGFKIDQFFFCYGLAEATAFVSGGGPRKISERICHVDPSALEDSKIVYSEDGRALVSCGITTGNDNSDIRIVNPETREQCKESQIGEIWASSYSVSKGYWNRPQLTQETMNAVTSAQDGPFLRTGDLGFINGGKLFITGRIKDLIIISGKNHYPQDIERTVEQSHEAMRPGCQAAFAVDTDDGEQLVVVQEVRSHANPEQFEEIVNSMKQAVSEEHGLLIFRALLIVAGTIPKTSSGKIRRRECRKRYLKKQFEPLTDYQ